MPDSIVKKKTISIIIINYNLASEIANCLNSLISKIDCNGQDFYEIIIVDNNSPDKKLPEVEKKFAGDKIKFFYLEENIGFGKGCNYGFSKACGEYVCFLNPDTIIKEDIFLPIVNKLKENNSIGIIAPRQQTTTSMFDFSAGFYPNLFWEFVSLFGIGVFFEGFIVSMYIHLKKNKDVEVDWVLGAAIFTKSELFKTIHGFDKDYFMFYEEVDLCKRVKNLGLKILYCPQLQIHHIGSVSGKKNYKLYTIRTYSSKYLYISKHYRAIKKYLLRLLLYGQLFSQILIWLILYFIKKEKSKQKIAAFVYLLKNKFSLTLI